MKKNFYITMIIACCITAMTTNTVMAADPAGYSIEQSHPRSPLLKTTSVKLKKTNQMQKNQIVSQLVALKGIKSAYFKGNTVYISYNAKRISSVNVQAAAKNAYNAVVKKHHQNQIPQPGRHGNEIHPTPHQDAYPPKPNNHNPKPNNNHSKPQNNNHNNQPNPGRRY